MSYLVTQMWMCLLAAGLLGFVLGWLLKQLGFGSKLDELETSWKSRLSGVEGERDKLRANAAELATHSKKLETDWTTKYGALNADHDKLKLSLVDLDKKYAGLDADWKSKWASLDAEKKKLAAELEACGAKTAASEKDLAAWKLKFADLEKTGGAANADHDALNAKLAAGAAALAAAEAARISLGNDSKKLAAELEAEKAKHSAVDADWKSKWALHDKEITSWKMKFADLEKAGSGSKADHDSLSAKLAAGAAALAAAEAARLSLGTDSKKLATQLEEERAKWANLEKERNQLKADLDLKVKHDHEVHEKHKGTEAHWKAQFDKLTSDLELKTKHDHEVHEKHKATEAHWKAQLDKVEGETSALNASLSSSGKLSKDEHDKFAAAEANWKSRWVALEKERDGLKAQLEATGSHDSGLQGQLKDANTKLAAVDTDWKSRWMILEKERDGFRTNLDASAAKEKDWTGRIATLEAELEKSKKVKHAVVGDIEDIEGIGPSYGEKLRGVGIAWIKQLLERGATKEGREEITASSGIGHHLILKWANMADLLRLWGVTPNWAELLEASGVDTVKEIKHRVPGHILTKMTEVNAEKHLAPSLPSIELVTSWVEQAKAVPPILTY